MKRPLWFRRHGLHWTPCAWQGWLLVAVFALFIIVVVPVWAPTATGQVVAATLCAVALVIGIAAATDDTHRASE